MKIYINGRFLTQRITGVQRYALEITRALDSLISDDKNLQKHEYIVIAPKNVLYSIKLQNILVVQKGVLKGHLWEQLELPIYSRDGFLMNFCNCAPLLKRNQTVAIYDAAVSAMPQSFSWLFRTWYRIMFFCLGKMARQIFTCSEFSKKELHKYFSIPLNKTHVIYPGIEHIKRLKADESIISRVNLKGKKYVLAASSMNPSKNFSLVLDIARLMPDIDFIIAGGSDERVFKSAGLDIPQNARFIGYVSDEELMALYRHASVFVYPSLYEGFGIPPLEAMMCGCPAIVSDIEVFHEVYGDSVEYCDCYSVTKWKQVIENVLTDKKKYYMAICQCTKLYTWNNTAKLVLNIF